MKENERQKSNFVYPDKLYARTNDNITLDISYAPHTMEAVEYVRTDAFVEKACSWMKKNGCGYWLDDSALSNSDLIEDFKNYMKQ